MPLTDTTTRPAETGGIDLSGIDIEAVIFEATGGGYGAPGTSQPETGGEPLKSSDWVTNSGNGTLVDQFDFGKELPADKDALIKLVAEPEGSHPLIDLLQGDEQPVFANGGPEGNACAPVVVGAIVIIAAVAVAAAYLGGAFDDKKPVVEKPKAEQKVDPETGLTIYENQYTDPEAMTNTLQSPAEMMASLLGKAGISGVDPTSVEITNLVANLMASMDKVADLVGALNGAAQSGDTGAFDSTLSQLMELAGIDGSGFDFSTMPADTLMDGVFDAYGISGGLEGATNLIEAQDSTDFQVISEARMEKLSAWISTWDDGIA